MRFETRYRIVETNKGFIIQEKRSLFGLFHWWGTNDYWKKKIYSSFNDAKTSIVKNCIEFKPFEFSKPYGPKYKINEVVSFYDSDLDGKRTNNFVTGRIVRITVNSNNGHVSYEYCMADSETGHVYVEIPEKYVIK